MDEIWGYVGKKQRHVSAEDNPNAVGDVWTFVALDPDTRLVPSFKVGKRDLETAGALMMDLRSRLTRCVQISTGGLAAYVEAIGDAFGAYADYAQVVKSYETEPAGPGRYSPPKVKSVERTSIFGKPDLRDAGTSYVERQNLTVRMKAMVHRRMRRLTRLTNAFPKKRENVEAAVALHFAEYSFVRVHQTLRVAPAMEAGVTNRLWSLSDLLDTALEYAGSDSN